MKLYDLGITFLALVVGSLFFAHIYPYFIEKKEVVYFYQQPAGLECELIYIQNGDPVYECEVTEGDKVDGPRHSH